MKNEKKECEHESTRKCDMIDVVCQGCGMDLIRMEPTNATLLKAIESLTEQVQILRHLVMMPKVTQVCGRCKKDGSNGLYVTYTPENNLMDLCSDCHKVVIEERNNETKEN